MKYKVVGANAESDSVIAKNNVDLKTFSSLEDAEDYAETIGDEYDIPMAVEEVVEDEPEYEDEEDTTVNADSSVEDAEVKDCDSTECEDCGESVKDCDGAECKDCGETEVKDTECDDVSVNDVEINDEPYDISNDEIFLVDKDGNEKPIPINRVKSYIEKKNAKDKYQYIYDNDTGAYLYKFDDGYMDSDLDAFLKK